MNYKVQLNILIRSVDIFLVKFGLLSADFFISIILIFNEFYGFIKKLQEKIHSFLMGMVFPPP